jgi:hypothetical protein
VEKALREKEDRELYLCKYAATLEDLLAAKGVEVDISTAEQRLKEGK